jgi:hypothetical protein
VGRVRIYEHFSGFGFFPLSDIFLAHSPLTQTVGRLTPRIAREIFP